MFRTAVLALALGLATSPAAAALMTETLAGSVQSVGSATGVAIGEPVSTVLRFDASSPVIGDLYDVTAIQVTLPGGVVLDESDDALGGFIQVGWDGSEVTSLFAILTIDDPVYGFAGGTLEFQAFGDGSLDFLVTAGTDAAFEGTVVPLPAALPLLATALGGLAWLRHRRRAEARG